MWQTFFPTKQCDQEQELRRFPELTHKAVAAMWPDGQKDARLLWAWTPGGLLVRTHEEIPLMVRLLMIPGADRVFVGQPVVEPFDTKTKAGASYSFELVCVPARTEGRKRFCVKSAAGIGLWMGRQEERCGIQILDCRTDWQRDMKLRPGRTGKKLHFVSLSGRLICREPELLETALCNGLGRGRAWGAGMLRLASVTTKDTADTAPSGAGARSV